MTKKTESMLSGHVGAFAAAKGISTMNYENPPIVEAVIQLSFENPLSLPDIDKLSDRLLKNYSTRSERQIIRATFETSTGKTSADQQRAGVELRDDAATKVLVIDTGFILFSALAPYGGWETLEARALHEMTLVRDTLGPLKISRIGMRFVNRIDVPDSGSSIAYSDYVLAQPKNLALPNSPLTGFLVQITQPLPIEGGSYTMACGTVDSPLPSFVGISVDIDVSVSISMSLHLKRLVEILRDMRVQKNRLFESIITDSSRALFKVRK